jgi:hypothetical protein
MRKTIPVVTADKTITLPVDISIAPDIKIIKGRKFPLEIPFSPFHARQQRLNPPTDPISKDYLFRREKLD